MKENKTVKKIASYIYQIAPKSTIIPLCMVALANLLAYTGARVVNLLLDRSYVNMTTSVDAAMPTIPFFSIVYVMAFPFWVITYIYVSRMSNEKCYRLATADIVGKLLCGAVFLLIPTTNVRPVVETTSFSSWLLNVIYFFDLPNNLFPSIHCLKSWLCFAAIREEKTVPMWTKVFSFVMSVAICVATLYTKQHVVADALAGVFIGELFWQLAPMLSFNKMYSSLNKIIKLP